MRYLFLIMIILLVWVLPTHAAENFQPGLSTIDNNKWTTLDTSLEVTFVVLTIMDWRQTRDIQNHPVLYETNRVLGRHPSARRINTYIPLSIIAHAAIAAALPKPYRTIWQSIWIGIELNAVNNNASLGLSIHF